MNGSEAQRVQGHLSEVFASYQGEGAYAGDRHLFVRFAGCDLRCRYCDTPDSLVRVASCAVEYPLGAREVIDNPIDVSVLARVVARFVEEDPTISMISATGGEPMLQHAFIGAWLTEAAPARGVMLETHAMAPRGLPALLPRLAAVSADIKLPSNSGEQGWAEHRAFLELCAGAAGVRLYVKMPVDDDTDDDEIGRAARLVAEVAPSAVLFVQPITDSHDGRWRLGSARMGAIMQTAAAANDRAAFRPQLHKLTGVR
jgi:organic radical activating enzyme